jgi:nitroreductase
MTEVMEEKEAVMEEQEATESAGQVEMYEYVEGMDFNPVERVILERRSVRKYKDEQVPEGAVRRILEAGRYAPSAGNTQPWKFVVIRDRQMIQEMERDAQRICKFFSFFLDWRFSPLGRLAWLYSQVFIRLMPNKLAPAPLASVTLIAQGKLPLLQSAPTVICLFEDKRGAGKPEVDLGICGQNMVLAAHSLGLGTCWIGFIDVLLYLPKWKKRLGIEYPYRFAEAIALGYPVGKPDGMVPRELQEIDWYEDGRKKTVY